MTVQANGNQGGAAIKSLMAVRKEELRRRVEALQEEVGRWYRSLAQDKVIMRLYSGQTSLLGGIVNDLMSRQRGLLGELGSADDFPTFSETCSELVRLIIKTQLYWDYFRQKLDLRLLAGFREPLLVADSVLADCFQAFFVNAVESGAAGLRYLINPLAFFAASNTPGTLPVGARPVLDDGRPPLGLDVLPFPLVQLPWDQAQNYWEFGSLHHEVGHVIENVFDLEADLNECFRVALLRLKPGLSNRSEDWARWRREVFADLVALRLGGPAIAESLIHQLLLPRNEVIKPVPNGAYPPPYLRVLLSTGYVRRFLPGNAAAMAYVGGLEATWKSLYGAQPRFDDYLDDLPFVVAGLMESILPKALSGKTVDELLPYGDDDERAVKAASEALGRGDPIPVVAPRLAIPASRLAVSALPPEVINDPRLMRLRTESIKTRIYNLMVPGSSLSAPRPLMGLEKLPEEVKDRSQSISYYAQAVEKA